MSGKNLILLHLDSVSNMPLWLHLDDMPTLRKLMTRSLRFVNFHSASTTFAASLSDLLMGDSSGLDHLTLFSQEGARAAEKSANLMSLLVERGYVPLGVQYGFLSPDDAPGDLWGIWPEACGAFQRHDCHRTLRETVREYFARSRSDASPFVLYFRATSAHLCDRDPEKEAETSYSERFHVGYRLLDASVRELLLELEESGQTGNTVIATFGNHGDDLWRHGVYRGRSHGLDPYATLTWCPLSIHMPEGNPGMTKRLTSMIDLKAILCGLLFGDAFIPGGTTPFSGIDTLRQARGVAFAQSMPALMAERSDARRSRTKSYAVTDGDYRLVASAKVDLNDSAGLELYVEQWDCGNTRNLLDFFRLNAQGEIVEFTAPSSAVHPHFRMTMHQGNVIQLVKTYESLRAVLYSFVKAKEEEALRYADGGKAELFPDVAFSRRREKR